jgi:hypothetical protein
MEQPVGLMRDKSGRANHAFQATAGNRPLLSARVNLLTKTEDFSDAVWSQSASTVDKNVILSPIGTMTGNKFKADNSNSNHLLNRVNAFNAVAGVSYTQICYAKKAEYSFLRLQFQSTGMSVNSWANFNTNTGTVGLVGGSGSAKITLINDGWYLCAFTDTAVNSLSTGVQPFVLDSDRGSVSPSYLGDGTSGIYVWGADLRPTNSGALLPPYQRVNTATDYDTVGFPLYLKCNGSSSAMSTNSINFTATDKMTVVTGVRKLSDAGNQLVLETSANADINNGAFYIINTVGEYKVSAGGTARVPVNSTLITTSPSSNIISLLDSITPSSVTIRNNLISTSSTTTQGNGSFGNYPLYLFTRGSLGFYLNGNFYGAVIRGAQSDTNSVVQTENYMAKQTGITF